MRIVNTILNFIRTGVSVAILVLIIYGGKLIADIFEQYFWRFQ